MNIKRYELLKRKELLGYLKVQNLKGYVSYLDVNEINNLINKVSAWYDLKYPNYELAKLDINNFKLEDMNILSQYMNSDELFKRLSFLENTFLMGEYRYKKAGSIKRSNNKIDNLVDVIWIEVPRKSLDPKCSMWLKPLDLKLLVDVKSGMVLNIGELDEYIYNVHSLKLDDLLKALEPFKDTLDLRNIDLSDDIVIDNYVVFGKINLYVTDNVKVVNNVSTVFGRTNIKYKSVDEKIININLKGVVLFGGVSVK